jgi:hypothetical protein
MIQAQMNVVPGDDIDPKKRPEEPSKIDSLKSKIWLIQLVRLVNYPPSALEICGSDSARERVEEGRLTGFQ